MFVEYENEEAAQAAVSQLNGYRLDKSHTFKANMLNDFEKYKQLNLNKEIDAPAPYKNPGNLYWWLVNPDCYDQFALQFGDSLTNVYLNTPNQPSLLKSREVNYKIQLFNTYFFYSILNNTSIFIIL